MMLKTIFPAVLVLLVFDSSISGLAVQAGTNDSAVTVGGLSDQTDLLVGSWECSNGVFTYGFHFQANGTLVQQEPTFGNPRTAAWNRLSEHEISVKGGPLLTITLDGDDRMSVFDPRVSATWDCTRK